MAEALRVALDGTPLIGVPTGVGAFCAGLLGALATRDDVATSVFAVSWRRRHEIGGRVPDGVSASDRPMPARPLHWAWSRAGVPPIEWFTGRTDVVHGTNYVVPPAASAARVVTVHDLTTVRYPEFCQPATLAFPRLVRRAVARGAWVHTHARCIADEVVETFGADPARVRAVPSGIPRLPAPDLSAPARLVPEGTRRYVLAVGTAEPRKDLPGLVRAFDAVARTRTDLALVLAGPRGWGSGDLAAARTSAVSRERIVLTGWLDDAGLAGLLAGATVLAYPSWYEGFGYPPLQAMQLGTPVVATRAGSLEEVLGDAALLVAPGDRDALADAIATMVDDEETAEDYRRRGRARARRYTWDRCAEGMMSLYRDARAGWSPGASRRWRSPRAQRPSSSV